ncbi:MAG: 3-hydroxyanthranilate 3,4-dioxygenase [Cetobacterium sp.]
MLKFPILNLKQWVDENRALLKPPIGNKVVYSQTDDFIIMVVGGPNARTDYHYNETEEFFYMLEGNMVLRIQEDDKPTDILIREGEIFLLPPKVPHSPQREANSIGIVIERVRNSSHTDGLMWFCGKCNAPLYKEYFALENIMTQMQAIFEKFYRDTDARMCKYCGDVLTPPEKYRS